MNDDPVAKIKGLYHAWRLQDIDTALIYCADDVRYSVYQADESHRLGDEMIGKARVREYMTAVCATWEFLEINPGTFTVDGDVIHERNMSFRACLRHSNQNTIEGRKRHMWIVRDGLIQECHEYQDAALIRAFMDMMTNQYLKGRPAE